MENKKISLSHGENSGLASKLFGFLKSRIKGQDPVIGNFVKYIESLNSGLRRPNSPIYKGLFLGLPNVGKRLFVESLAEAFFGNKHYYSEISCGAFNIETVTAVPMLLARANIDLPSLMKDGGYRTIFNGQVKLQELLDKSQGELFELCEEANKDSASADELKSKTGALTKHCLNLLSAIETLGKRLQEFRPINPISIVVFSDFERSCPTMINIIHRLLRDGRVSFEGGHEVDLTNSIVIVTSTIISEAVMEEVEKMSKGDLGFAPSNKDQIEQLDKAIYDRLADPKKIYKSSLKFVIENISLDFLSLFDRISIFRPLFKDSLKEILDLELQKFYGELAVSFPVLLTISDEVKNFIAKESADRIEFGASTLLAKFDKHIRREVARLKNRGEIKEADAISAELKDGNKVIFSREPRKDEIVP